MHNLASAYHLLGRYVDPETIRVMNNLANSYTAVGRYADAHRLHQNALELKKAKLGINHPSTLMSMYNVA